MYSAKNSFIRDSFDFSEHSFLPPMYVEESPETFSSHSFFPTAVILFDRLNNCLLYFLCSLCKMDVFDFSLRVTDIMT